MIFTYFIQFRILDFHLLYFLLFLFVSIITRLLLCFYTHPHSTHSKCQDLIKIYLPLFFFVWSLNASLSQVNFHAFFTFIFLLLLSSWNQYALLLFLFILKLYLSSFFLFLLLFSILFPSFTMLLVFAILT